MPAARVLTHQRAKARKLLVQALYQWLLNYDDEDDNESLLVRVRQLSTNSKRLDVEYLEELCRLIELNLDKYREAIAAHLDREWGKLDPTCKSILLLGAAELIDRLDVPYRVCLNEAITLSKTFGSNDEVYKYTNAVLDKIAQTFRQHEQPSAQPEYQR